MREVPTAHVPPAKLWQCACAGQDLPLLDYEHVMGCKGCEQLISEIAEALDDIANQYRRPVYAKAS